MGRVKPKYPEGNFTIRTKPNKKGEVSIYLVYNINSVSIAKSTGIKVLPSDWDVKTQCVRLKNPDAFRINGLLKVQRDEIDTLIRSYAGVITAEAVKRFMGKDYTLKEVDANPAQIDFIQFANDLNKQRFDLQKIAYSTYYNAGQYILQFQRFITKHSGESVIYISDLSLDLFEKYKAYRIKNGNSKEGVNKMLTPLFKAVQYAKDNELMSIKQASTITSPYFDLKERKYKSEIGEADVHYLTEDQLQKFIDLYDQVHFDRTREIMDMFLFSFHACGLRVSDIITLEWSHLDLEKRELNKNLFKGNVPHTIPLTQAAIEILTRWKKKNYNQRFVFDLLPASFNLLDEALLDERRKSKNRTLQMSLVEIGNKMGLPFNLTMHVARHTFAVLALQRGVTLHMISRLLGHSSILTTEKVYATLLPDTITDEVVSKLSFCSLLPAG